MEITQELADRGCLYLSPPNSTPPYHFVGVSGNHLAGYINFDPALSDTVFMRQVAGELVEPFQSPDHKVSVVATAATGSIPLGALSALALTERSGQNVHSVWADKTETPDKGLAFAFTRPGFATAIGAAAGQGKEILIVDDVINRQFTIKRLIAAVRQLGGYIAGVAVVATNGKVSPRSLDVPTLHALCEINYRTWSPEDCALRGLCDQAVPIVTDEALGHGAGFARQHPTYRGGYVKLLGATATLGGSPE